MRKKYLIELIIIIVLGLTPLLWFNGNQLILGHDSGLTLSPVSHFLDRLSVWTDRVGFGSDQTYAIAGFFIHGLDALISFLGFNIQYVQKIGFIFWFMLPGLTMYYFASKLAKKFNLTYFALPASIFYMFNHFLLQGWFVAERTKFSVYAALPLVMSFLFDWDEKRRSTLKTAVYVSLTFFVLNGAGSFPLFGGVLLTIFVFIIFYLIKRFSKERILGLFKLFGLTFIISAFLNSYWLIPYVVYLFQSFSSVVSFSGGLGGVMSWLTYVSRDSSLINLLRLQGIPEWYLNPFHPYADVFLKNIFFITVSYLIPVAAFLPLYKVKNNDLRKKIIFFSFLALFTIIFAAGSHPPFGAFYMLLINFVPGFVAFRNPLYKFSPALWFSYAVLIAFTINYLLTKLEIRKKIYAYVLYAVISMGIVLYSYPFLTGSFFNYSTDPNNELTTRVTVPAYIFDFIKWEDSQERKDIKTLVLPPVNPDNRIEAYSWGYWGPSSLTTLLTNASIINETSYMSGDERAMVRLLYEKMRVNQPGWQNFAKLLGIESFLLRKDYKWEERSSPTFNPLDYVDALQDPSLKLARKMGEWDVYDFKDTKIPDVKLSSKINYLVGDSEDLIKVSSLPDFNPEESIYVPSATQRNPKEVFEMKNSLYLVPPCVTCNLMHVYINTDLYKPLLTIESKLYILKQLKNWFKERKLILPKEKITYFLYKSLSDVIVFDKFIYEKKPGGLLTSQINEYDKSLKSLDSAFSQYLSSENLDNNLLLEIDDILRIEETTVFKNPNNIYSKEVADSLSEKFKLLSKIRKKIDEIAWRTTDETNKKFLVNSNSNQEFKLVYRSNYASASASNVKFQIDNKNYEVFANSISSGWLSLGNFYLSKGLHRLNIVRPPENLYKGESSIQIGSSSNLSCFYTNSFKGNRGDIYRISFQHKRLSGSEFIFARVLPEQEKPNFIDRASALNPTSVWNYYSMDYIFPSNGAFYLTVCNYPTVDKEFFVSSVEIKDINIREIKIPEVVFYSTASSLKQIESKTTKNSQTEYSISKASSKDKEIVVLSESANKNWVLDGAKNNIKIIANGYANGWIIDGNEDKIKLKYKLQNSLELGFLLSGVSFILILLYLLIFRKK